MSSDEAELMLAKLAVHFREPVLPVSRYCNSLRTWRECVIEAWKSDGATEESRFSGLVRSIWDVELAIDKSSLLDRLIYWGEPLRTRKCPKHQGHWSGLPHPANNCECGLTGWLPEPESEPR